jgi:predicted acetyltransferase
MAFEIRHIREEEIEAFNRTIRIAFAAADDTFSVKVPVEWTLCAFEDGRLATSYMAWPLTLYFDYASIPVAGVSMVGTLPLNRRRGHLRMITQRHFEMLYEAEQQPISALLASMAAIYHRFGYGIVSSRNTYNIEPRHLKFAADCAVPGKFYEADDDDMATILDVYHKFAMPRVGCLQRNEKMEVAPGAPLTVLAVPPSPVRPMKVVYREGGEPKGYMIYSVVRGVRPGDQHLDIRDLAWLTPQAYRAIWDYFANMDLVQYITWARLVDVRRALPLRPYRKQAVLTFEVVDDLCPWNAGKWILEASPDGADVKQTGDSPQLTMPVSTLAMLMFGQITATEAARMARLDVHDADSLEAWDIIMKTPYRPFCADMF